MKKNDQAKIQIIIDKIGRVTTLDDLQKYKNSIVGYAGGLSVDLANDIDKAFKRKQEFLELMEGK